MEVTIIIKSRGVVDPIDPVDPLLMNTAKCFFLLDHILSHWKGVE